MDFKTRTIITIALFSLAILATLGCEITAEQKATRTAEALVEDSRSRPSSRSEFAASTAVKSGEDDVGGQQVVKRVASSGAAKLTQAIATAAPTATSAPQPTATSAALAPTSLPQSTATSAPTATSVPTAMPVHTATPVPDTGPWLTALQAFEIATDAQAGVVKEIIGHVTRRAGEMDVGDDSNDIPSPGAGYSSSWNVSIVDGDESLLCVVRGTSVSCDTLFGAPDAELAGVGIDSPAVFDKWENVSEWSELLVKENISILLLLQPWPGGLQWTASITVNGAAEPPYGGNFSWNLDTGETGFVTY